MVVVVNNVAARTPSKPAVVCVNGVVIPREKIMREVQNHPAPQANTAWQDSTRALVVRELLLQEAARLAIAANPLTDETGRHETAEEAVIRALLAQEVKTPEPDEPTCRRYYERNLARFRSPTIYEAAHILFAARRDDPSAFEQARCQAEAVLAMLRLSPERFAALAAAHSACTSAPQGGNLGQVVAGETTPEFEEALFALQPGSLCDAPVATRYGFHLVRLDRRIEARQLPFELVSERIADYLRERSTRRALAQYVARLVSRASITGIEIEGADAHRVH